MSIRIEGIRTGPTDASGRPARTGRRARRARSGLPVLVASIAAVLLAGTATPALAQGTDESADACEEAARLIRGNDLDGALDEARWCLESLEQLRSDRTFALFPETLEGYAGGELESQNAMGMTMMNRSYTREGGANGTIDVSLASGAAGSGLAALAQMGMSLGGQGRKLRVRRRTVVDTSDGQGSANFLVELRSGGMLTIASSDVASDDVLDFVKAFPIEKLDDAMKR